MGRPPGSYEVGIHTEVKRQLSLTLDKGQIRFVRLEATFGFAVQHISPELVDDETGESEIATCHYWDWSGLYPRKA